MAKILLCAEFTYLNTGYATYYRELAKAFTEAGHKVVEIASFGDSNIPEHVEYARSVPWKVYLNIPDRRNKENFENFRKAESMSKDVVFGAWLYNDIMLMEKPDYVIGLRDYWYERFITESPLSKYTNVILSPTVDAAPQKGEWLDSFSKADALVCYNQWSEDWLKNQMKSDNIRPFISPSVSEDFEKRSITKCRAMLNLPEDKKIVGTIMRNQPRKLFGQLFEAIERLSEDISFYCHTTYPDMGWEISELIVQHGIQNRVYLTYKCLNCSLCIGSLYKGRVIPCPKCNGRLEHNAINSKVDTDDLCNIYNSFDLYVQYANSEGFGIPASEAASMGKRVVTIDYAAQSDVGEKIQAIKLKPLILQRNVDFNCYRAIADNNALVELLNGDEVWNYDSEELIRIHNEHYSWEKTTKRWLELIDSIEPKNNWYTQRKLKKPVSYDSIKHLPNHKFIEVCVVHVAQDLKLLGTRYCATLLDSLNAGVLVAPTEKDAKHGGVFKINNKFVYDKFFNIFKETVKWEERKNQSLA